MNPLGCLIAERFVAGTQVGGHLSLASAAVKAKRHQSVNRRTDFESVCTGPTQATDDMPYVRKNLEPPAQPANLTHHPNVAQPVTVLLNGRR